MSIRQFDAELRRYLQRKDCPPLAQIAEKTGISIRWLQLYRRGDQRNPRLKNLILLWDYLNA